MTSNCRSCHAPVYWARGADGKNAPVDADSADKPGGNIAVWREQPGGKLRWRPLKKDEDPGPGEHRGMNHFATCPDAAAWKADDK